MLYIGSDHGGYKLKEVIKEHLAARSVKVLDVGPESYNSKDDYPDFARLVAERVSRNPESDLGILICRSGQGVNITANKFRGVRAALVWNSNEAIASRTDDLSNVLSIPADYVTMQEAKTVVDVWLNTPMGAEERHVRRVKKIKDIEDKLLK